MPDLQPDSYDEGRPHVFVCYGHGDRSIVFAEITALLEHRQLCQDAHHCPHGRPTALVFSREELDRRFKRI